MTHRSDYKPLAISASWTSVQSKLARKSEPDPEKTASRRSQLPPRRSLRNCDESNPDRCAVELVQRGRLIVDVSAADLEAAEAALGAFHPTTWYFRNTLNEARRSWERLRAELGSKALEAALKHPPLLMLSLGGPSDGLAGAVLILIAGQTYRLQRVPGTQAAPVQWQLTRLRPPLENGPYFLCRLADGSMQCDCADWTYQVAQASQPRRTHCKHLAALATMGCI
jgi:hypothetical protein